MFPKIMREIKTKADTDSPELTGIPTAPTPSDDTNTNQIANIEYITSKLGNTDVFPDDSTIKKDSYLATNGLTKFWTRDLELDSIATDNTNLNISSNNLNLYGWGKNSNNILNSVETTIHLTPFKISNTCWKSVYCISYSTITNLYAIDKDDYLYTWGNDYKLLGIGSSISQYTPYKISQITKWKQMFVNRNTFAIFAIDENDLLYAWGNNDTRLIPNGNTSGYQTTPYLISETTKWKVVYTTAYNAFAIDENGYLYGWGNNEVGQLGLGNTTNQYTPIKINASKWKTIYPMIRYSESDSFVFAIDENDHLYSWGKNDKGSLGTGKADTYQYTPYIFSTTTKWKWVSCNNKTSFGMSVNNELYGWGDNGSSGLVGNGFRRYMVRHLVGGLIQVGAHRITKEFLEELIESKGQKKCLFKAKPQGLYLHEVFYK